MKSIALSLLVSTLLILPGQGQTRQVSFAWPLPQASGTTALASLPVASLPWISQFETNIDKLKNGPYDLVFDGDSITAGWLTTESTTVTGETVWQQYYGGMSALDIGIGGDMVQHLAWRVQNGSLAGQDPKLIVVLIGTNNVGQTPSDVVAGIQMLLGQYEARCPHAHILLQGIFPRGWTTTDGGRVWVESVNAILAVTNFGPRVTYVDFSSQFLEPDGTLSPSMMADGLHPGYTGYTIWTNAIQPYVNQYVVNAATYPYSLTVTGGSGSGSYPARTAVAVTAAAPPNGSHFAGWTGDIGTLANPSAASTTVTMLAQAMSITATYSTTQTTPPAPTGLTATDGSAQNNLYWTAVTGSATYNIYRGTSAGGESATPVATGITSTSYTDTGVLNSTAYYYKVAAVNSSGTSGTSNESSATPINYPSRQITFVWPQPQEPSNVAFASFPVPRIDWVTSFETNVDKLQSGPYNLVFDGDSIMSGYQNVYQQYYGSLPVLDLGIYGDQVQNMTWRAQNGELAGQNPKLIVLEPGSQNYNQNPSDVAAGIQLLLSQYESCCPSSHILLLGILPCNASATDPARTWISQVNQILATYASSTVSYLDIGSQFLEPDGTLSTDIMPDGYNPSAEGYAILSNAIQPMINEYVTGTTATPSQPLGLGATAGNAQVRLSWAYPGGPAASYNIYRGTTSGGEAATPIATGIYTTNYTDTAVANGTTYFYTVAAVNSSGTSAFSTEASATPNATIAVQVVGVQFPLYYNGVNRTLNTGSTGYSPASSGGYTAGLVAQRYWNIACSSTNNSDGIITGPVTNSNLVLGNGAPAGSTNLLDSTGSATSIQFSLTNAVYQRSTNANGSFPAANYLTAGGYADAYLASGVAFATAASPPVTLTLTGLNPAHYFNIVAYVGGDYFFGSAGPYAVSLAGTTYYIKLDTANTLTTWIQSTATTAAGAVTTANYVEFMNVSGSTLNSQALTVTGAGGGLCGFQILDLGASGGGAGGGSGGNAPAVPTGLWSAEGPNQVSLSWTSGSGATSYNVYRGTSSGGENATPIASGITATSFTDLELTNGATYYYTVASVNSSGTSGNSNETSATPLAISNTLTVVSGSGSGTYPSGTLVQVSADAPATGYQFAGWTGATSALANPALATTTLTMPTVNTIITATYSLIATGSTQIAWGIAHNMAGESDVLNNGSAFDSITFYSSAITVHGVTFNTVSGTPLTDGTISVAYTDGVGVFGGTFSGGSAAYGNLTKTGAFGAGGSANVTLSKLTIGDTYQVQSWSYYTNDGTGTTTYSGSTPVSLINATGQFATGTFTAASTSLVYAYSTTNGHNFVNAISVRNITPATGTSYTQWSANYFAGNPANAGGAATPLDDGVSNLLKYLFDINPTLPMNAADRASLPVAGRTTISGTSYLTLTYRQNPLETGLVINVQTSPDLQAWQTVTPSNTLTTGTDSETGDPMIQYQVPVNPTGASKEFIRLNVVAP